MVNLINDTPQALVWVKQEKIKHSGNCIFGKIVSSVIWTDNVDHGDEPVGGADPSSLITEINAEGLPLLRGHDPGFPIGKVLAAELFTNSNSVRFVAAILGLYEDQVQLSFNELNLNPTPTVSSPLFLNELNDDCLLIFATDPREVDSQWSDKLLESAPFKVKRSVLSHNAAESVGELIRIGLPYVLIVWNPFITSFATEAGKNTYTLTHQWLRSLWNKLVECRNPIVSLQSHQEGCEVSFLFRGRDVKQNYDAHDALPIAAAQAAKLITGMKSNCASPPVSLVYEFEPQNSRWFPSYATLDNGQLVSDRNILIAIEQLPTNLSLGIELRNNPKLKDIFNAD